jgi:hypothetical protein
MGEFLGNKLFSLEYRNNIEFSLFQNVLHYCSEKEILYMCLLMKPDRDKEYFLVS